MNTTVCSNHPDRAVKAKGLCGSCYESYRYWRNPVAVKTQRQNWRSQNPERVKEARKRSWAKNKGRYKTKMKEWYEKNSTHVREQRLQYYGRTRDVQILKARDYAFKKRYGITVEERDRIIAKQNNCCAACGEPFCGVRGKLAPFIHHDHKLNRPNFIAVLHARCNIAMGQLNDDPVLLAKVSAFSQMIALKAAKDVA